MVDDEWLTVGQVAELLSVSVNAARSYADAGRLNEPVMMRRLPARGDRRIHRSSAERLLGELAPEGEEQPPGPARGKHDQPRNDSQAARGN